MAIGKVPGSAGEGDLDEEGIFAEINITPLTDIFLVLLIIFMVTSSVIADAGARSGLRVNLPKGATKEVSPGSKDVTVAIGQDGKMMVDGKLVDGTELARLFAEAKTRDPATQIIVHADESTAHGRVVSVMELAKTAGLSRLAISTRKAR
ncbi:MAG TPA: biopolymer transporter ExbD [Pseudomonadota bacterium]|jgi:biopolymer transport protein ExbD|nr:biopolymer transporter ExbD [Pseudomonadota bacterium]HND12109.1 biopolymer transporter ExbD [Pseudomonadota bacterium]HNN49983.1 biopolymer transporter ExbD [Pseudomonadota bacterium]